MKQPNVRFGYMIFKLYYKNSQKVRFGYMIF